nr:hypothetical protein [Fortiea contorta]
MQMLRVLEEAVTKPPIPYEPHKHSLKAWVMYCLRERGFKVVYAQNADFAIESKGKDKVYFKVSTNKEDVNNSCSWIVWDSIEQIASVIP